jgi:Ca-activated chloride channel family protein
VRDEIVELGTRYGLVTPYTSYLATDGTMTNTLQNAPMAGAIARDAARKVAEKSGSGAVQFSIQQNTMQANAIAVASEDKDERQQILLRNTNQSQFVANKSFINQQGVWIDAEYSEKAQVPEVSVKFGSDEYFRLVARETGIAQFLALGEKVVVVWKGKVYRITI